MSEEEMGLLTVYRKLSGEGRVRLMGELGRLEREFPSTPAEASPGFGRHRQA